MMMVYSVHNNAPMGFYVGHLPDGRVMLARSQYRGGRYWDASVLLDERELNLQCDRANLDSYSHGQNLLKSAGKQFTVDFENALKDWLRRTDYSRYCMYYGEKE